MVEHFWFFKSFSPSEGRPALQPAGGQRGELHQGCRLQLQGAATTVAGGGPVGANIEPDQVGSWLLRQSRNTVRRRRSSLLRSARFRSTSISFFAGLYLCRLRWLQFKWSELQFFVINAGRRGQRLLEWRALSLIYTPSLN